jgi:hypothetical protein
MLSIGSVLVDFDGTACLHDVAEHLLIEFGDPSWPELDAAWERGELDSRRVITAQASMLDAPLERLTSFAVEHCPLDPTFAPFVAWLGQHGIPVTLVSDGFSFIRRSGAAGLNGVHVITNAWSPNGDDTSSSRMGILVSSVDRKMNAVLGAHTRRGRLRRQGLISTARCTPTSCSPRTDCGVATGDGVRSAIGDVRRRPGPLGDLLWSLVPGGGRCPGWRTP